MADDGRECVVVGWNCPADVLDAAVFGDGLEYGQACEPGYGLFWQKCSCGHAFWRVGSVCDRSRAADW